MSTTQPPESFQIPLQAAEAYEATFVPAFFAQWAPMLCDAAGLAPGERVLDVACGTGIVARTAADRVGRADVVGVDLNEAMLSVASRAVPDLELHHADVADLPFPDDVFDVALCQMALMFFPDRLGALREVARVVAPSGRVAVLVPADLDVQAAYGPFVDMAARIAGADARSLLSSYFACGHLDALRTAFQRAGLDVTSTATRTGIARFPSVDALVATEVDSTPLGERLSPDVAEQLRAGARDVLAPFTSADGRLEAPFDVHIVVGAVRKVGTA
jgi:SAM-dependent methyltransferase